MLENLHWEQRCFKEVDALIAFTAGQNPGGPPGGKQKRRSKPPRPAVRDAAMNTSFQTADGSSYPPAGGYQPRRGLSEVQSRGRDAATHTSFQDAETSHVGSFQLNNSRTSLHNSRTSLPEKSAPPPQNSRTSLREKSSLRDTGRSLAGGPGPLKRPASLPLLYEVAIPVHASSLITLRPGDNVYSQMFGPYVGVQRDAFNMPVEPQVKMERKKLHHLNGVPYYETVCDLSFPDGARPPDNPLPPSYF
jgi:hypothetical protein